MTLLHDSDTDSEKKACILATAERLFRDVGYLKTTVADIAKTLKMSPANIYRFFDSKKSIHEGVARRLMAEVEDAADAIAAKPGSPRERMHELLATISIMNAERFVGDSKIHEMVAIAMEESWDVCDAHIKRIMMAIAAVIADGAKSGAFNVKDVEAYFFKRLVPRNSSKKTDIKDRLLSQSSPPCLSLSVRVHAGWGRNCPGQKSKTRRDTTETGF